MGEFRLEKRLATITTTAKVITGELEIRNEHDVLHYMSQIYEMAKNAVGDEHRIRWKDREAVSNIRADTLNNYVLEDSFCMGAAIGEWIKTKIPGEYTHIKAFIKKKNLTPIYIYDEIKDHIPQNKMPLQYSEGSHAAKKFEQYNKQRDDIRKYAAKGLERTLALKAEDEEETTKKVKHKEEKEIKKQPSPVMTTTIQDATQRTITPYQTIMQDVENAFYQGIAITLFPPEEFEGSMPSTKYNALLRYDSRYLKEK